MQLIPAIDLRQGKVIRLSQGDDARRTLYDHEPADLIRRFADAGVGRVHIVDLDAAFGEGNQRPLIAELAGLAASFDTPLLIELGGGLRDEDAVSWALDAGCDRLVLGSMVVKAFDRFAALVERFPGRLVPAVETAGGELKISGWTESAKMSLDELCSSLRGLDCSAALVTDVDRDGEMVGPNLELARHVAVQSGIPTIVSGGVTNLGDLQNAVVMAKTAVEDGHGRIFDGVITGKALYEERFTLEDALAVFPGSLESQEGGA